MQVKIIGDEILEIKTEGNTINRDIKVNTIMKYGGGRFSVHKEYMIRDIVTGITSKGTNKKSCALLLAEKVLNHIK